MVRVPDEHLTERVGVYRVGVAATGELKWIFREQPVSDVGIDGELEPVIAGEASGQLIGVQIKSGESYFRETADAGFVFRGDLAHLEYWSKYANPVVLVIHRPSDGLLLWEVINDATVERTDGGWKLVVPLSQELTQQSKDRLLEIAQGAVGGLEVIRTEMQEPLLTMSRSGTSVILEVIEWVNKTSGRTDFRVLRVTSDGVEEELDRWMNFLGGRPVAEAIGHLFPWSTPLVDDTYYDAYDEARFDEEEGIWDSEDGRMVHFETFGEWAARNLPAGPRPYVEDGEIARWRIVLDPDPIMWASEIVGSLAPTHADRIAWETAIQQAEMTHQAEPALRRLAERIVDEHARS